MQRKLFLFFVLTLATAGMSASLGTEEAVPVPAKPRESVVPRPELWWKNAGSATPLAEETDVSDVSTGGLWEHEGSYGSCRIVVRLFGTETTGTFVYAQWLRFDENLAENVLSRSLPVAALNDRLDLFVEDVSYEYGKGTDEHTTFLLKASSRETNRPRTIRIVLGKPGEILSVTVEGVPDHPQSE